MFKDQFVHLAKLWYPLNLSKLLRIATQIAVLLKVKEESQSSVIPTLAQLFPFEVARIKDSETAKTIHETNLNYYKTLGPSVDISVSETIL